MNTKKKYLPSKRSFVDSFLVMDVLAESEKIESRGNKVFHLELGEPLMRKNKLITKDIQRLVNLNLPGYSPSNGIKELRDRISEFYRDKNINIEPEQVFITSGSSGAFVLTFLTCFDPGDHVAIFNPSYPAYRNILKSLNLNVVEIHSSIKKNFMIDLKKIANYKKIKGLIISSPNNPNGQIFSFEELKFIYEFCKKHSIKLISDEIYHGIEYEKKTYTLNLFGKDVIVINSFSKYFCMPGWRLGWVTVPYSLKDNFLKLSQNLFISSNNIAQYAAIKSFEHLNHFDKNVEIYLKNRNLIYRSLRQTSWNDITNPMGGFYFYLNVSKFTNESQNLVKKILEETGVALTSGMDFDKKNGNKTIRLSFSRNHLIIKEAVKRLVKWINHSY